jgi:hypothetical protein
MLAFTGAKLDRAPIERRDPAWLAAQRARPEAGSVVMSERGLWVDDGRLLLLPPDADSVFLGLDGDRPLFAMDGEPDSGHPAGLREAATELPAQEAALGRMRPRCCRGTGATASARTAASRPRRPTAATSVAARPVMHTISHAPTRW